MGLRGQRWLIWGIAVVLFVVLMVLTPAIKQSQSYHTFADRRNFFGIPNTLNVVSNFPFLVIGVVGMVLCVHDSFGLTLRGEVWGWMCFFFGIGATAFGSAYYHLNPNDARLVWDRLPMTIAFSSVMAVFIIERIDERTGSASLLPLLAAGVISVAYWRFADDLRLYALVQFVPCIAIPAMTILLPPRYSHSIYWLWAAGWYVLAKICEALDKYIYKWTNNTVSGHTLKHLFAAIVPVCTIVMLTRRIVRIERQSLFEKWKIQVRTVYERQAYSDTWRYYWRGNQSSREATDSLVHS